MTNLYGKIEANQLWENAECCHCPGKKTKEVNRQVYNYFKIELLKLIETDIWTTLICYPSHLHEHFNINNIEKESYPN